MDYSKYIRNAAPNELSFPSSFKESFDPSKVPDTVAELYLPHEFGKNMVKQVKFPDSVTFIHLGDYFNEEMEVGFLPAKLQTINFGCWYNKPIKQGVLPNTVEELIFGDIDRFSKPVGCYNLAKEEIVLPPSVEYVDMISHVLGITKNFHRGTQEFNEMFTTI